MTKEEVRQHARNIRQQLSDDAISMGSKAVAEFFFNEFNITNQDIHVYITKEGSHEINTSLIIDQLFKKHPDTTLVTSSSNFEDNTLRHFIFDKSTTFKNNRYYIPEPVAGKPYDREPDIIIIPLLGYDKQGHRVGYGRGFYDRFLIDYPKSFKVGLSLLDPVDNIEDTDSWDVKLDYCINPRGVITF